MTFRVRLSPPPMWPGGLSVEVLYANPVELDLVSGLICSAEVGTEREDGPAEPGRRGELRPAKAHVAAESGAFIGLVGVEPYFRAEDAVREPGVTGEGGATKVRVAEEVRLLNERQGAGHAPEQRLSGEGCGVELERWDSAMLEVEVNQVGAGQVDEVDLLPQGVWVWGSFLARPVSKVGGEDELSGEANLEFLTPAGLLLAIVTEPFIVGRHVRHAQVGADNVPYGPPMAGISLSEAFEGIETTEAHGRFGGP